MEKKFTDEEIESMNREVQSFRKARKFEFIILDPTGVEVDRHVFHYTGGWGNRILLKIDDWEYYAGIDGKYVNRIGPEPQPEEEILLSNPKDPKTINWDGDEIFVIRYQALTHAQAYMTGDAFDKAERFLKENEDRYIKLTTKNKP
jgi:hypothetical protein